MKHNVITRRAFLLSSLALLACLVCGVLVWKGFGKSLSDLTANWPQNADAASGNAGTPKAGHALTTFKTKHRIREEQPSWLKDPKLLKQLTPEMAKLLILSLGDMEVKTRGSYLNLIGLTTLDAETAKALAEFKGDALYLRGLTTLDAETARALAEFKGKILSLDGLTTLDAETAKALAEFKGEFLSLSALTTLDAETSKALAEFEGYLRLDGLTTLDAEMAKRLAENFKGEGILILDGLTTLDAETAKALAECEADLYLGGLTTLDAETVKALAEFKGQVLYFSDQTTLGAEMEEARSAKPFLFWE